MKINQVTAIEKTTKNRVEDALTAVYQQVQKADLFEGLSRQYRPIDDKGEQLPPESKKVQVIATEALQEGLKALTELFDITATKDYSNQTARANVVIDGQVLIQDAPVPFLLFLEKKLIDIRTFASSLPTLDPAEDWKFDANVKLSRTEPKNTHRTKKVTKPIVKYDATDKHPAQTELITEDVLVGFWELTKLSGAITVPTKKALVERVERLQTAVKVAREEANAAPAVQKFVGADITNFLTAGLV